MISRSIVIVTLSKPGKLKKIYIKKYLAFEIVFAVLQIFK